MIVMEPGIVIEVNPLQPRKASSQISVTEFGMDTVVKPELFIKAQFPMVVTEFGIVTDVRPVQFEKPLRYVTEVGILTDVNPTQLSKAATSMWVTLSGMEIEVNPAIPIHKKAGMRFTLFPKVKLVIFEQPANTL